MITFYLVRHGETLFNTLHKMQGWCDSPLTQQGIRQAVTLGKGLQDIPFLCAYSSSSERCLDTAHYILKNRKIPLHSSKDLKELYFGTLEGASHEEGLYANKQYRMKIGYDDVGGETREAFSKRVMQALISIAKDQTEDGNILIVTHAVFIITAIDTINHDYMEKLRERGYEIRNGSVTNLTYDQGFLCVIDADNISYFEKGKQYIEKGL